MTDAGYENSESRVGRNPNSHAHDEATRDEFLKAVSAAAEIDSFDLRHLRYFLAVVSAGSVSGAAQEMHISQPSLSQQIRRLERRLGTALFRRTVRGVELTRAGRAFLDAVQGIPTQLRAAISAVAPALPDWKVGVCGGVPEQALFEAQRGLSRCVEHGDRTEEGEQALTMRAVPAASQPELISRGELAFGIIRWPHSSPGLVCGVLLDEPLGVVMRKEHPLAAQAELTWDALSSQRLVWYNSGCAPGYSETVTSQLAELGWQPTLHPLDQDQDALFRHALLSVPGLVALRPASVVNDGQLVWRPLPTSDAPRERLALATLAGSRFESTLRRAARQEGWSVANS
ncbi:DNA-binding transcriptional LysR family regulator [Actinopolyspora lacussalsi]|nr:DNA-binding transcriptional LysR family regulator [Actinopolyspora lacussalsi]